MADQADSWSKVARRYEEEFVDPYRMGVRSPLMARLTRLADTTTKTAADLGCGIGPLLPALASRFHDVYAVDFAAGMLQRARERCAGIDNIRFIQTPLTELGGLAGQVDVAVAINSLVMPSVADQELCLRQIHAILRPGGSFLG